MIKVQDLLKNFNGKTVLNRLNFQIQESKIVYLVPNGAGKTTTMRIIRGLLLDYITLLPNQLEVFEE